ncbi:tetratricopeptide repeat protein [Plantactinospora siamensis]|uniref:Tetratricopeptide repeat protein n=1 Tax=Plantactinospora siamensis TaxID=555372 RepID=A0ABV6P0E8_9ACTN
MRQVFGSLACGAVLLAGVAACSDDPKTPAANQSSDAAAAAPEQKDPTALLKQGIEQGQAGQADQAKATFEKVVSLQGDNKFAWFNLGYLAQSRNATDEAIADYDKALAIDGAYRPAMYNKAMLLEGQKPDDAVALYRKIIDADSHASTAYLRLGLMLVKQDDADGARDAFKAAVKLDPKLASAVPAEYQPAKAKG